MSSLILYLSLSLSLSLYFSLPPDKDAPSESINCLDVLIFLGLLLFIAVAQRCSHYPFQPPDPVFRRCMSCSLVCELSISQSSICLPI